MTRVSRLNPVLTLSTANATYSTSGGTWMFSAQTASIAVSAAVSVSHAFTLGNCRLSCTGAPAGSNLVVDIEYSTNGGSTWTGLQTLTIVAGSTTAATANPAAAVPANSLVRVNCTSAGSGTAAVGVLFQADYQ